MTSRVTLAPYVLTDADGSNPRITFPVMTPAAFVVVESRQRGVYVVTSENRDGARIAIDLAKAYVRSHGAAIGRLYSQMDRIRSST